MNKNTHVSKLFLTVTRLNKLKDFCSIKIKENKVMHYRLNVTYQRFYNGLIVHNTLDPI